MILYKKSDLKIETRPSVESPVNMRGKWWCTKRTVAERACRKKAWVRYANPSSVQYSEANKVHDTGG